MAITISDSVIHWRKKIERNTDEDTLLNVIRKLSKVPITIEILQETHIGKCIRKLSKRPDTVGKNALHLLKKWRDVFAKEKEAVESDCKSTKSNFSKKENLNGKNSSIKTSSKDISHKFHQKTVSNDEYKQKPEKSSHSSNSSLKISKKCQNGSYDSTPEHEKSLHSSNALLKISKKGLNDYDRLPECEKSLHSSNSLLKVSKKCLNDDYDSILEFEKSLHSSNSSLKNSKKCMNGVYDSIPKDISLSHYTNGEDFMNYDPDVDMSEGYNPECPELYPSSDKSMKLKKSDGENVYEPSSVKRKLNSGEQSDSSVKSKKLKSSNHSNGSSPSESDVVKNLQVKKEKSNFHEHKNKNHHKSHSSGQKDKSGEKLKSDSNSKHKSTESKKSKPEKKSTVSSKGKVKINSKEEFTSSEVRFEDCLGFNDIVTTKKKKSIKSTALSSKKSLGNSHKTSNGSSNEEASNSKKSVNNIQKKSNGSVHHEKVPKEKNGANIPKPSMKLDDVDIVSTLPEIQPHYTPLPYRSYESISPKKKVMTDEEAIKFTSSRREKTAVYSGRKNFFFTEVLTLQDLCIRILIENIDAIEYLGGVPYFIMKPVLERCNPSQLEIIEHYNPYLVDDTHDLWEIHCKKDYRNLQPDEDESWRELYWRAHAEREMKLKSITANISASMHKSGPARQVKLAYVDSVAKPPRDVARRQAKHGTALPVSHPMKIAPPSKASPRPTAPVINSTASTSSSSPAVFIPKKPKIAPLMAKTLKSMKQCFRRK